MDGHIRKDVLFATFWLIVLKGYFFFLPSIDTYNMSMIVDKVFEMLDSLL
jgi:hypothetical protein